MFDLGSAVGYLMLDSSGFVSGFGRAQSSMEDFFNTSNSLSDRLGGLSTAMTSAGSTLTTNLTLPLVGLGTAAMKVGNDFEAQMSRVKAISGATGEELKSLKDLALQLGADTSFSASQAAEGMESLASAGFTVDEIMDAMPGLLDLAASSGADLGVSTEIAASAIRGFGLEASEAGHVADVFAEAAARTNAQTEDMGEAMKYIAPVAKAMGQSLEETAAAIGIMSDAGIKGSQAGTSLRAALSRLAKPTQEMYSIMKELGLSFYDAQGNMIPLNSIVSELEEGMSDLTQEQRNNALVTLFGQESLSGMLSLMERGSDELVSLTKSFEEADGSAKEMSDTMLDNTSGAIEAMFGSIETLGIKVQEVLAPAITDAVKGITDFVNSLSGMDEENLKLVVGISAIVASIGPLLLVGGKIIGTISTISGLLSGAGISLAALTGPIGIVIGAVTALAAAWATNFGGIRDQTQSIMDSISTIISTVWEFIKEIWESNFLGIQEIVSVFWENLELAFSTALETISLIFEVFALAFQGDWEGVWEKVGDIASTLWNGIKQMFSNFLNILVNTLIRIGVRLWQAAKDSFEQIKKAFGEVWNLIISWFEEAIQDPVGTVLSIGSALFEAGKSIFNSLWDGLKSIWEGIVGWVSDCVDWLVEKVKFWEDESEKLEDREGGRDSSGSYASGLSYVPREMNVTVHEGERILTKQENQSYIPGGTGGDTFIFNSPKAIDPMEAERQFIRLKKELAAGVM